MEAPSRIALLSRDVDRPPSPLEPGRPVAGLVLCRRREVHHLRRARGSRPVGSSARTASPSPSSPGRASSSCSGATASCASAWPTARRRRSSTSAGSGSSTLICPGTRSGSLSRRDGPTATWPSASFAWTPRPSPPRRAPRSPTRARGRDRRVGRPTAVSSTTCPTGTASLACGPPPSTYGRSAPPARRSLSFTLTETA
jgi:hypothetical protein